MSEKETQHVVVTDIHMPFWSMVVFMVKWAIAAIPAVVLLVVIVLGSTAFISGVSSSLRHGAEQSSFAVPYSGPNTAPLTDMSNHQSGFGPDVPDRCKGSTELAKCIESTRLMNLKH